MKNFIVFILAILLQPHEAYSHQLNLTMYKSDVHKMSLTAKFLSELVQVFNVRTFVETGTARGGTTNVAKDVFKTVHSIEMDKELFEFCKLKFRKKRNVHLYLGNSSDMLPVILKKIKEPALFWLDGHNSPGMQPGQTNTPLLHELDIIQHSAIKNAVLLIDDIRCSLWQKNNWDDLIKKHGNNIKGLYDAVGFGWPTLPEIINAIKKINPRYVFALYCDTLLAFVDDGSIVREPLFDALMESALSMDVAIMPNNTSEDVIRHMSNEAFDCIKQQVEDFIFWEHPCYHPQLHLWYGLGLLERKYFDEAKREFQLAQDGGLDYQRMELYKEMVTREQVLYNQAG